MLYEAPLLLAQPVLHRAWVAYACLMVAALAKYLIVRKPVELYRRIEIRLHCMILDGTDLFWRRHMESGWPTFQQSEEGHLVFSGIYGTQFVEYLIARRFDEYDRAPEMFAAHLQEAVRQLWTRSE